MACGRVLFLLCITHNMATFKKISQSEPDLSADLVTLLNNCKSDKIYTSVTELRLDCCYRVIKLDRVLDIYGEFIVAVLEGRSGDDFFLTVALPKRYKSVLSDRRIENFNMGLFGTMYMVRRSAPYGSLITPLEFV